MAIGIDFFFFPLSGGKTIEKFYTQKQSALITPKVEENRLHD
jgi:hypothetical protein